LETEASRLSIAAAAAKAAYRGDAPHLAAAVGTDLADIRSGALAESIQAGDKVIEQIVRRAAVMIGRAAGDIVNLLNPDTIILGGGLVEALPELILAGAEEGLNQRAMAGYLKTCKVVTTKLGDEAVVRGAAAWCENMEAGKKKKD
jgi:glucokinase